MILREHTHRRFTLDTATLGELRAAVAALADAPDTSAVAVPGMFGGLSPLTALLAFVPYPPAPAETLAGGEDLGPCPPPAEPVNFIAGTAPRRSSAPADSTGAHR